MEGGAVTAFSVGAVVLVLGYLVRFRRWESLIAGNNLYSTVPPVTVSLIGNVTLVAGGFVVALGLLELVGVTDRVPEPVWLLAFVGVLVVVVPRLPVDAGAGN